MLKGKELVEDIFCEELADKYNHNIELYRYGLNINNTTSLINLLRRGFLWRETPEGHDYWQKIKQYNKYINNE